MKILRQASFHARASENELLSGQIFEFWEQQS